MKPSPSPKFPNKFTDTLELDKPIDAKIVDKFILRPYHYELLYHGIVRFYKFSSQIDKTDKASKLSRFAPHEFLKIGDQYAAHQPNFEKEAFSVYEIVEITDQPNLKSISCICVKPSPLAGIPEQRFTVSYQENKGKAQVVLNLEYKATNPVVLALAKTVFKQSLRRFNYLANAPQQSLHELEIISSLNFDIHAHCARFPELPYAVGVGLFIDKDMSQLQQHLRNPDFLKQIFPNFIELINKSKQELQIGDKLTFTLNNTVINRFSVKQVAQKVELEVRECSQDSLKLYSTQTIDNFHNLGFSLTLEKGQSANTSLVKMATHYSRSNMFGAASAIQKSLAYFTSKVPEPGLILLLAARNMLEGNIRRFSQYLAQQLNVTISTIPIKQPAESLQVTSKDAKDVKQDSNNSVANSSDSKAATTNTAVSPNNNMHAFLAAPNSSLPQRQANDATMPQATTQPPTLGLGT